MGNGKKGVEAITSAIKRLRQMVRHVERPVRPLPRSLTPTSRVFGFDRGTPIDRLYIEAFLSAHSAFMRGDVYEVGDSQYFTRFAKDGANITVVGHPSLGSNTGIQAIDFETGIGVEPNACDCLILTQVLPFIFDLRAAISSILKLLRPGGAVLTTVSGLCQISRFDMDRWGDYWRFTDRSAQRLFADSFGSEQVEVRTYGNVATAQALLDGLCVEEMPPELFTHDDPDYQVVIGICARKRA